MVQEYWVTRRGAIKPISHQQKVALCKQHSDRQYNILQIDGRRFGLYSQSWFRSEDVFRTWPFYTSKAVFAKVIQFINKEASA